MMEEAILRALNTDQTIDITTTGRKTGSKRRIEIWFHNIENRIFITGLPGKRSWYANMLADPYFIFHLKSTICADLLAKATPVVDEDQRREILGRIISTLDDLQDFEAWVAESPLVEVEFLENSSI